MAKRPAYYISDGKIREWLYSFEWFSGFALSQKQKSIDSLHQAIIAGNPDAVPLEISTKSKNPSRCETERISSQIARLSPRKRLSKF